MESRFIDIFRWQLSVDAGKLLKWFAASFFINLVLLFISHKLYTDVDALFVKDMSDVVAYSLNFSILQMALLYPLTRLLAPKVDPQSRVAFMMLPASHARKFWMRTIFLGVVCAMVWIVGFILADAVQVVIAQITSAYDTKWATPAMVDNAQRTFLPSQTPREAMVAVFNAMDLSQHTRLTPDSIQALQDSMKGFADEALQLRSLTEAGWGSLLYGLANWFFTVTMCLFCGAMFRNVPWVFALIASFVFAPLIMVLDYVFNLGMGGLALFLWVLGVVFLCCAYNIFKKTQVINNKLLNV